MKRKTLEEQNLENLLVFDLKSEGLRLDFNPCFMTKTNETVICQTNWNVKGDNVKQNFE